MYNPLQQSVLLLMDLTFFYIYLFIGGGRDTAQVWRSENSLWVSFLLLPHHGGSGDQTQIIRQTPWPSELPDAGFQNPQTWAGRWLSRQCAGPLSLTDNPTFVPEFCGRRRERAPQSCPLISSTHAQWRLHAQTCTQAENKNTLKIELPSVSFTRPPENLVTWHLALAHLTPSPLTLNCPGLSIMIVLNHLSR